jgi:hypothetical protein
MNLSCRSKSRCPDFIDAYSALVLDQIAKKAAIHYPDQTTLIVQCTLNSLYMPEERDALILKVRAGLPQHSFPEIFMYNAVSEYACSL